MAEHITANQWTRFFSGDLNDQDRMQVLLHAAECEQCRKLMEKAGDLRYALAHRERTGADGADAEAAEYRAVAGIHQRSGASGHTGYISVQLVREGEKYLFSQESPETSGIGNMYALNLSADRRSLLDDGDALSLRIGDDSIFLHINTDQISGCVHLLSELSDTPDLKLCPEMRLELPRSGWCELEIVFGEE